MNQLAIKQTSCPFFLKCLAISVVLSLSLCKFAQADDLVNDQQFFSGFKLGGYSSANLTAHTNGKTEASLDEISLFLSWEGDSRFRFFSELELERPITWNDDHHFTHDNAKLDLERLYLDYNISDKVNLRAGRFLTAAGRWNLLHAAPLVWTSTRPLATSRLFPVSTNGIMVYGATPLGDIGLEYSIFVEALEDQHRDNDETLFKDIAGARFELTGKFNLGLSLMEFKERINDTPEFKMIGLDFLTHYQSWEFSGEAFQRYYDDGHNGGSGAYLQAVAPLAHDWFAIARIETFQRPEEGSSDHYLIGTAWRLSPNRILKVEYAGGDEERSESPKGLITSFAILF